MRHKVEEITVVDKFNGCSYGWLNTGNKSSPMKSVQRHVVPLWKQHRANRPLRLNKISKEVKQRHGGPEPLLD